MMLLIIMSILVILILADRLIHPWHYNNIAERDPNIYNIFGRNRSGRTRKEQAKHDNGFIKKQFGRK